MSEFFNSKIVRETMKELEDMQVDLIMKVLEIPYNILVDMGLLERSIDEFGSPQTIVTPLTDVDILSKFQIEGINDRFKNFGEELDSAMNASKS